MLLALSACGNTMEGTPYTTTAAGGDTATPDSTPSSEPENDDPPAPDNTPVTVWLANGSTHYDQNGEATGMYQVTYDERGNEICLTEKVYYDGWETTTTTYSYDANNRLLNETYYTDYYTKNYTYTYDSNGNILTIDTRDINNNPDGYMQYTYGSNGMPLSYISYNETGEELSRTEYVYNENQQRTKTTYYFDAELYRIYTYAYDASGKMILSVSYDGNNKETNRTEYVYDEDGNETESISSSDGEEYSRTQHQYDTDGKILKDIRFEQNEEISYTEYTYDENGNLTQIVTVYDGEITEKIVISYTSIIVLPERAKEIESAQHTLIYVSLT
jgi:hypothetical protein